jgi:hypothetical protein
MTIRSFVFRKMSDGLIKSNQGMSKIVSKISRHVFDLARTVTNANVIWIYMTSVIHVMIRYFVFLGFTVFVEENLKNNTDFIVPGKDFSAHPVYAAREIAVRNCRVSRLNRPHWLR